MGMHISHAHAVQQRRWTWFFRTNFEINRTMLHENSRKQPEPKLMYSTETLN